MLTATVFGIASVAKNSLLWHDGTGYGVKTIGDLSQKTDKTSLLELRQNITCVISATYSIDVTKITITAGYTFVNGGFLKFCSTNH